MTQLFSSAPDLLEDFKQFLPESAAQAKAQAAARQATEDAAMLSNVRGETIYNQMQPSQVQTPRPDLKMPPVGNFAPPPSIGKENKKRRGGAGSQITGGAAGLDQAPVQSGQNNKNGNIRSGTANKVSVDFWYLSLNNRFLLIIQLISPNIVINKVFFLCTMYVRHNAQHHGHTVSTSFTLFQITTYRFQPLRSCFFSFFSSCPSHQV